VSTTSTWSEYNFNIDLSGQPEITSFAFSSPAGMTDALALDVLAALNGIAWPAGTTVGLSKATKTETDYVANPTATPPTFT
jgi:hypothetical protein